MTMDSECGKGVDVVGLGQCSYDIIGRLEQYPALDQKAELTEILIQGGGPVATALVTLARLGLNAAMLGRVGSDRYGAEIRKGLEEESVDCQRLLTGDGSSQVAFIAVDHVGHRNIFWHRGTVPELTSSEIDFDLIASARILHLDGLHLQPALTAASFAREKGVVTVLDAGTLRPGITELLPLIDHLVVSEKFARQLAGHADWPRALEKLAAFGCAAATVTLGREGSLTWSGNGQVLRQEAFRVQAVDTTGCGDVFHGGYIYGLIQGWTLSRTIAFASACAALKTRQLGGRAAIPSLSEVTDFLKARNVPQHH